MCRTSSMSMDIRNKPLSTEHHEYNESWDLHLQDFRLQVDIVIPLIGCRVCRTQLQRFFRLLPRLIMGGFIHQAEFGLFGPVTRISRPMESDDEICHGS